MANRPLEQIQKDLKDAKEAHFRAGQRVTQLQTELKMLMEDVSKAHHEEFGTPPAAAA